jgi:O-antigen ligase/tetratricopeptide (TPR) repeat protein
MFPSAAKPSHEVRKKTPSQLSFRPGRHDGGGKSRLTLWCDRVVIFGLACLVVFSPLAIGSVNPWAFCTVETIIFLLTIVWMARLAVEDSPQAFAGLRPLLMPAALFIALILFQLVPLPPTAERVLSPATYRLYATSLPGWPGRDSYPDASATGSGLQSAREQSSIAAAEAHTVLFQDLKAPAPRPTVGWSDAISRWRPISIAPGLTGTAVLKLIAYGCLFFLVLFYPLRRYPRPKGERRFCRRLLKVVLITGLAVGCIGLLEQAFWNGAILWLYVPYDWGQPRPGLDPRAVGPFVNPDHFAAYLNLILPLALAGALFDTFLSRKPSSRAPLRLFCLAAASILISAIALTLSRGGWIGGVVAVSMVIWLALLVRWRSYRERAGIWLKMTGALYVVLLLCIVAGSALYTAPEASTAVNARLEATFTEPDFGSRLGYWRDSLALIRDFPTLGVGLGSFQDLFPRYQSPPWRPYSVREAHNDYIELTADVGVAGLAVLLWFCLAAGIRIYRGLNKVSSQALPVVVALMAGVTAIAFQEFFDFALQIPGNAVLFTIFLALALRLSGATQGDGSENSYAVSKVRLFAAATAVAAVALIGAALRQDLTPYPYLAALPRDAGAAKALIFQHPARATPHLWYAALEHGSAAGQMRELAIAASLEPINPLILDRYAQALAANGRMGSALAELTRSVFVYPTMADHFYLQPGIVPWLSMEERKAIDAGFRKAIGHKFNGAGPAFAAFCAAMHHDAAEADVLAQASSAAEQPARRAQLLLDAGAAYARADETARAKAAFEEAAQVEPANPRPYQALATQIFAPRKDIESAKAALQKGLKNGADPFALYLSLAQVYEQAGDLGGAETALLDAAKSRPDGRYDYDTLMRLADMESRARHFDKAALWIRRAIDIRPGSADALYQLALAEEADYEYGQALRDLVRAMKLAPDNEGMREHYRDLMRMIAAHSDHNHPGHDRQ